MKKISRILCFILSAVLCISLCACDFARDVADMAMNEEAKAKTFDLNGVTMELTTDFLQMDFMGEGYDFVVGNGTITVMGLKVTGGESGFGDMTVLEFAEIFRATLEGEEPSPITELDGIPTMQYSAAADTDQPQTVAVMYYEAADGFWVICFATLTKDFESSYADICKYAKSVQCQ